MANNATHIANLNPLRYRSYVYDNESGFYYLMSRYYDPTTGRFLSPDSQLNLSTMHGCNLYAYCENDPVNRADPRGEFFAETIFGVAVWKIVALITGALVGGWAIYTVTDAIVSNPQVFTPSLSLPKIEIAPKAEEKDKDVVIPKGEAPSVLFPENPNNFNPNGLTKVSRTGTKNGSLISWMDPLTNTEIFRWDENPNWPNGPHYHVYGNGHYYPGMKVPEPYATIYFPLR